MLKNKSKTNATLKNQRDEEDLTERLRQEKANTNQNNLYMSYRRDSKSGLRKITSGSSTKLTNDLGYQGDDTFDSQNLGIQQNKAIEGKQINIRKLPINYTTKNLSQLNHSQSRDIDASCTEDTARMSETSHKSTITYIKEFLEAAAHGNREKIDQLLNNNKITDINVTDSNNRSGLHYAVSEGRFKTVCHLLSKSINPNLQSRIKKESALHIACKKAYKKIIVSLLNHNADPNLQDSNGRT